MLSKYAPGPIFCLFGERFTRDASSVSGSESESCTTMAVVTAALFLLLRVVGAIQVLVPAKERHVQNKRGCREIELGTALRDGYNADES